MGLWLPSQKPARGAKLNKAHPLSRGLWCALPMNEGSGTAVWDYAANKYRVAEHLTFPTWVGGQGLNFNTNSGGGQRIHISPAPVGRVDKTVLITLCVDTDQSNNIVLETTATALQNFPLYSSTADTFFYFGSANPGANIIQYGKIHRVISQYRAADAYSRGFLDGKLDANWAAVTALGTGAVEFCLGSRDPDTTGSGSTGGYEFDGRIYNFFLWNRLLTTEECILASANPYAMFERPSMAKYFFVEEAGADVSVDATTVALTLTENAANINAAINVQAGTDALAITTYTAGVNAEINVAAGVVALAITTNAATVNAEINVQAGADALSITEYAATVEVGADVEVAADTAALTITAYPATVNAEISIAAATDALSITEYPANINAGINIQASLAALTISEQAATVKLNVNVATALDALLLSTYAAGIKADISITAQVDALILAEFAASVAVVALTADNPASTIYARGGTKTIRAKDGTKSIKASAGAGRVIHG